MKSIRFLFLLAVFMFAALTILLVAAQSNPVARSNQPGAIPEAQQLPGEMGAQLVREPQVSLKFAKLESYTLGAVGARSVAVADLNGDGHPDLVVANPCEFNNQCDLGGVTVLLGNGDGSFQAPVTYSSGGYDPFSVAIGDVNGDGHPDLVVANWCQDQQCDGDYQGEVGVLLGNGDGTFQPPVSFSSGGMLATGIAVGDVNGDGFADLVVSNLYGTVTVFLSNGNGTFQSPISYSSGGVDAGSIAIADLNGDGRPDLVVGNDCSDYNCTYSSVGVLLGDGHGDFQGPVVYTSGQNQARSIAVADVNGDGYPDLVVANDPCGNSGDCGHNTATVLLGNGDGTFQAAVGYPAGNAVSVAIGDVNGDGYPDMILANETCGAKGCTKGLVSIMLGNGDGTFQSLVSYSSGGYSASSAAIADLNGDGRPDLIVANDDASAKSSYGSVGVMLNNNLATTKTKLTSSVNPSQVGQSVTFTATVTSSPLIPDGETVTFYNGATQIGTGTTTNGVATLTTSFSAAGKYTIKASYPGDAFHKAGSGTVKQTVK
jgi:hypothetical protein